MNEQLKKRFYAVEKPKADYKQKIRTHRLRLIAIFAVILLVVIAIVIGVFLYFKKKEYTDYTVLKTRPMENLRQAQYISFVDGVIKVNRDGAIFLDKKGNQVWNQTYEMSQPIVDVSGDYVAIGSLKENKIYILNKTEKQGEIRTEVPIRALEVSDNGMVAVLMEAESSYKIALYDKKSTLVAQGEFRLENTGYPIAIALSADGKKLGVSFVSVEDGRAGTQIQFYNFGSVGQNEIDNLVEKYQYEDVVIPQIEYLNKDVMVAYGTDRVILFEGEERPKEKVTIVHGKEIKTVFHSNDYWGVAYDVITGENANRTVHEIVVYDLAGKEVLRQQFEMKYESIRILNGKEVAIIRDNYCIIYTFDGVKRFQGDLGKNILHIVKEGGMREYTFFLEGEIRAIRLK